MKLFKALSVGAVALAGLAVGTASGQITTSAHNFTGTGWSGGEICKPCHTPHAAIAGIPRLWNHTLTTATYTINGGTMSATADFDTTSRLCLSCHDGTVALDSFGGSPGTAGLVPAGNNNLGTDLSDDHPVGSEAEYPPDPKPSWWDGAFKATPTTGLSLKNWVNPAGTTRKVVGCTTCHNAHGKGFPKLLVMSNGASAVCLGCHIK